MSTAPNMRQHDARGGTVKLNGFAHKELVILSLQNRCVVPRDAMRNRDLPRSLAGNPHD
jgi:hypothetical protein